jgi:hypothetical protein
MSKYVEENTGQKYFEIDSSYRNRNEYPNPCDFVIPILTNQNSTSNTFKDPILLSTPYCGNFSFTGITYIQGATGATGSTGPVDYVLDQNETNIDNFYIGNVLEIQEQFKKILSYSGVTKTATIESQYIIQATTGTAYQVRKMKDYYDSDVGIVDIDYSTNTVSTLNLLDANTSPISDFYKNSFVTFTNGAHQGTSVVVTKYVPSNVIPAFEQPTTYGSSEFLSPANKGFPIIPSQNGFLNNIILRAFVFDSINPSRTLSLTVRQGAGLGGPVIYTNNYSVPTNSINSSITLDIQYNQCYLVANTTYTFETLDISNSSSGFIEIFGIDYISNPNVGLYNITTFPKLTVSSISGNIQIWNSLANGSSSIITSSPHLGYSFPLISSAVPSTNHITLLLTCFSPSLNPRNLQVGIYQGTGFTNFLYSQTINVPNTPAPTATQLLLNTGGYTFYGNTYTLEITDITPSSDVGFIQIFGFKQSQIPPTFNVYGISTFPSSDLYGFYGGTTSYYSLRNDTLAVSDYFSTSIDYGFYFQPSQTGQLTTITILLTSYSYSGNGRTLQCQILNGAGIPNPVVDSIVQVIPNCDRQVITLVFNGQYVISGQDYTLSIRDVTLQTDGIVYFHGIVSASPYISYNTTIYPQIIISVGDVSQVFDQPLNPVVMSLVGNYTQGFMMFSTFTGKLSQITIMLSSFESVSSGRSVFIQLLSGAGLAGPLLFSETLIVPNTSGMIPYTFMLSSPLPDIYIHNIYTITINDITIGGTLTGQLYVYGINSSPPLYISYAIPTYPLLIAGTPSSIITISPPQNYSKFVGGNLDNIEFNIQALENSTTLRYGWLSYSRTSYWAVGLKFLIVPNMLLSVGIGGKLDAYPYICVKLYNEGIVGSSNTIYSNNPNSSQVLFEVFIDKYIYNTPTYFFTLKPKKTIPQIILFRPDQNTRFTLTLPSGEIIRFVNQDSFSPKSPNPFVQVSALFTLYPIEYIDILNGKEK